MSDAAAIATAVAHAPTDRDYNEWLARGRALSTDHSNHQWAIGDWLIEGDDLWNAENFVPAERYLRLSKNSDGEGCHSIKIPNYWKDAAAETGNDTQTLKEYAKVARAYPAETRFKTLSFTHHRLVAGCPRRLEYLEACAKENPETGRPYSADWLYRYAEEHEGRKFEEYVPYKAFRVTVPQEMWKKLRDVAKYRKTKVPELMHNSCVGVVEQFLAEQAEAISLEKYGSYSEGDWPFYQDSEFNRQQRALDKKAKYYRERRRKRADHKPEARAHGRKMAIARWSRGEKVA